MVLVGRASFRWRDRCDLNVFQKPAIYADPIAAQTLIAQSRLVTSLSFTSTSSKSLGTGHGSQPLPRTPGRVISLRPLTRLVVGAAGAGRSSVVNGHYGRWTFTSEPINFCQNAGSRTLLGQSSGCGARLPRTRCMQGKLCPHGGASKGLA